MALNLWYDPNDVFRAWDLFVETARMAVKRGQEEEEEEEEEVEEV